MDKFNIFCIILWINILLCYAQDCSSDKWCLRCVKDFDGFRCTKCAKLIVYGSRECVNTCPSGYVEELSGHYDYMGRMCKRNSVLENITMSGHTLAIIVGSSCGALLSFAALLGGCLYVRRRRIKALSEVDENSDSTLTVTPLNQQERGDFLKEVAILRREAPVFLSMMNDTRRQVREIWKSKSSNHAKEASIQAYRPVLRDLYVILVILNKPQETLNPPPDWRKLFSWGERVLKRYKRQNNITTPLGDLVSFLQVPNIGGIQYSGSLSSFQPYNTLSTHSTNTLASNISCKPKNIEELAVNTINDRYIDANSSRYRRDSILDINDSLIDTNPVFQPNFRDSDDFKRAINRFSFGDSGNWDGEAAAECSNMSEWSASREFLFHDHFVKLGFRPQDEITTEL